MTFNAIKELTQSSQAQCPRGTMAVSRLRFQQTGQRAAFRALLSASGATEADFLIPDRGLVVDAAARREGRSRRRRRLGMERGVLTAGAGEDIVI